LLGFTAGVLGVMRSAGVVATNTIDGNNRDNPKE
jgi:F0F1-type ATP synthase assembly protein I